MKQSLTISSQNITYFEWGEKSNPTLVFLHGLGSNAYTFNELATLLKQSYYIVALDLPGHGETDLPPNSSFQLNDLAEWLHHVLKTLNLTNSHIAGHSWGGYIALTYASLYQPSSTLLLDGGYINASSIPGDTLQEEMEGATAYISQQIFDSTNKFDAAVSDHTHKRSYYDDGEKIRLIVKESTAHSIIKAKFDQPSNEILANIQTPVMLIRSMIPEGMNEIRDKAISHLRQKLSLEVHDIQASHELYEEVPVPISSIIYDWIHHKEEDQYD